MKDIPLVYTFRPLFRDIPHNPLLLEPWGCKDSKIALQSFRMAT